MRTNTKPTTSGNDKVKGALHRAKGKVKQVGGKATDNPKLEREGVVEKFKGKVRTKIGQIKKVFGN